MIRKVRGVNKWKVISHTSGRSFGTYRSKAQAIARLKQLQFFKHIKKKYS